MKTTTQPEPGGFELFSELFFKFLLAISPFVALGAGLGFLLVPFSSPPTTEEIDREFLIMKQRPEDHFYNKASGSTWMETYIFSRRQGLKKKNNDPYYPGEVLFLRPDTALTVEIEAIGSRDTLFFAVEMGEYFQHRFEKESMTFLIPHRRLNVYVKLWQPFWSSVYGLERYLLGFFLLACGLGGFLLLFFLVREFLEKSAREGKLNIAAGTKTEDVHEPEVVEAEELTEEETRKYSSSKSYDNVFYGGPENKKTGENMDVEQIMQTIMKSPETIDVGLVRHVLTNISFRIKREQDVRNIAQEQRWLDIIEKNITSKFNIAQKFGEADLLSLKQQLERAKIELDTLKVKKETGNIHSESVPRKDQSNAIVAKFHRDLTVAALETIKPYLEMEGLKAHYQTLLDKTNDTIDYIKSLIDETNISPEELEDIILRIISGQKKSAADKTAEATQEAADEQRAQRDVLLQKLRKLRDKQADFEQRQLNVEQKLKDNPNDIDFKKESRIINDELEAVQDEILKMKQILKSI